MVGDNLPEKLFSEKSFAYFTKKKCLYLIKEHRDITDFVHILDFLQRQLKILAEKTQIPKKNLED